MQAAKHINNNTWCFIRPTFLTTPVVCRPPLRCFLISLCFLEFDQDRQVQPVLVSAQIRGKTRDQRPQRASVATRRSDSVLPGKIRDTGSPMVKLPAESDVLAGHVIEGGRRVPSFIGVAGI